MTLPLSGASGIFKSRSCGISSPPHAEGTCPSRRLGDVCPRRPSRSMGISFSRGCVLHVTHPMGAFVLTGREYVNMAYLLSVIVFTAPTLQRAPAQHSPPSEPDHPLRHGNKSGCCVWRKPGAPGTKEVVVSTPSPLPQRDACPHDVIRVRPSSSRWSRQTDNRPY